MKKVVLVGAGGRAHYMFAQPFVNELKAHVDFKGIYDTNPIRARLMSRECGDVPVFDDFARMLEQTRPDIVVVASPDHTHHTYTIAALEAGCDVVSEKPMTIDAEKCQAIMDAEARTGRKVTVTFNMRYMPYISRIKELLNEGAVGDIHHISLEYYLDRSHGADYFRRWHGELQHSGGLLVHKSTHHFDFVNWWIESKPLYVSAFGARNFYGAWKERRGVRCQTCEYQKDCEFYVDFSKDEFANRYYLEAEAGDGYIRDQCVFGDRIDIYDTMSLLVQYDNDAILTYSLNAYHPYEGWRVVVTGNKGCLEASQSYSGPPADKESNRIRVTKPDGEVIEYNVPRSAGSHGGGDERILDMIFAGPVPDPLNQQADSLAGAMSLLIGAAGNLSIAERRPVAIADLLRGSMTVTN